MHVCMRSHLVYAIAFGVSLPLSLPHQARTCTDAQPGCTRARSHARGHATRTRARSRRDTRRATHATFACGKKKSVANEIVCGGFCGGE
eukprot:2039932-Pleurochrysis_carterae.AAC.1